MTAKKVALSENLSKERESTRISTCLPRDSLPQIKTLYFFQGPDSTTQSFRVIQDTTHTRTVKGSLCLSAQTSLVILTS